LPPRLPHARDRMCSRSSLMIVSFSSLLRKCLALLHLDHCELGNTSFNRLLASLLATVCFQCVVIVCIISQGSVSQVLVYLDLETVVLVILNVPLAIICTVRLRNHDCDAAFANTSDNVTCVQTAASRVVRKAAKAKAQCPDMFMYALIPLPSILRTRNHASCAILFQRKR